MLLCAWIIYCSKIIYCDLCYETISGIMIGTSQYIIIIHETDNPASGKIFVPPGYTPVYNIIVLVCFCVCLYINQVVYVHDCCIMIGIELHVSYTVGCYFSVLILFICCNSTHWT